jgi:spermidine synthase
MRLGELALPVVVFLSAAAALMLEIVAGRLIAPYVGMSLYSWTAIIGVVLAGLSLGHLLGGRLAGQGLAAGRGRLRLAGALAAASLASLAVLLLLRLLAQELLGRGFSPLIEILALVGGLFFLPSLFAGIVSPLATKLAIDAAPAARAGPIIGRMFALGALGSIAGTLLTGFVLIGWLGSTLSVLVVAGLYAAIALALTAGSVRAFAAVALAMAAGGTGVMWGGASWRPMDSPCDVESAYYCLRIDDMAAFTGRPSGVLVIDHLAHGINDRDEPRLLYSPYLALADTLVRHRFGDRPLRAFFVGGGAYTLPRAWQREGARLLVAEIDPEVTRTAADRLWLRPGAGLAVDHADARVTLTRLPADAVFDVVFGDAYQDVTIPPHLVTREFHQAIARHLAPDGLYLANVIDAFPRPGLLPSLVRTLAHDFAEVGVWLDEESYGQGGRVTYLVVATQQPLGIGELTSDRFVERRWRRLAATELGDLASGLTLTDDHAPVDRLMSRITLDPSMMGE